MSIKPCSPLHPINVSLMLLGAGAIGLAARSQGSRNAQIPDLSFVNLQDGQTVNTERDYRANGVTFSPKMGAGSTPNNQNVNYMGFTVWMRPSEFLSLNQQLPQTQTQRDKLLAWRASLGKDVALGPPMLMVELEDEVEGESNSGDAASILRGNFFVYGHEGRHRMKAMPSDEPIPVHVFPLQLRARHFQNFDFANTSFRPKSRFSSVRVRPIAWALDEVFHRPKGSRMLGFDDFDEISDGPVATLTRADLFRNSSRGYTFHAHGRDWKVINSPNTPEHRIIHGHPPKLIPVGASFKEEPALYASLEGQTLVVHALSKRGPFAPVGKVLWREDMSGKP